MHIAYCHTSLEELAPVLFCESKFSAFVSAGTQDDEDVHEYKIGATICLHIDVDPTQNRPRNRVELRCPTIEGNAMENIPPDLPMSFLTWTFTSLENGRSAVAFTEGTAPDFFQLFTDIFPDISDVYVPQSGTPVDRLNIEVDDLPKNATSSRYRALMQGFGFWSCTRTNSLGEVTKFSLVTDMCEYTFIFS